MKLSGAKKNNNLIYFVFITIVLTIILLSTGFSAFQNDLSIGDVSATVQVDKDIRVMGISVDSVNEATSYYEDCNATNIFGGVALNNSNSYVIYNVKVYNLGNVVMGISNALIDNENLKF